MPPLGCSRRLEAASLDTRESRADNSVLIGVVLAAVLAILLIFGSRMFNAGEKSVDVNTTQPNIEQPATGETKKP